jgi:hypothetical protein
LPSTHEGVADEGVDPHPGQACSAILATRRSSARLAPPAACTAIPWWTTATNRARPAQLTAAGRSPSRRARSKRRRSGVGVFFLVLTVFFQDGLGHSALRAGLLFLPFAIGFSTASAVSRPITTRIGSRIVNLGTSLMGLALLAIIVLTRVAPVLHERLLVPLFLIYGLYQGLAQPALRA